MHCVNRYKYSYVQSSILAHSNSSKHLSGHIRMVIRVVQALAGVLACIMCIFILGPLAMLVVCVRVCKQWIMCSDVDYTDLKAVYPMFCVFVLLILTIMGVAQL